MEDSIWLWLQSLPSSTVTNGKGIIIDGRLLFYLQVPINASYNQQSYYQGEWKFSYRRSRKTSFARLRMQRMCILEVKEIHAGADAQRDCNCNVIWLWIHHLCFHYRTINSRNSRRIKHGWECAHMHSFKKIKQFKGFTQKNLLFFPHDVPIDDSCNQRSESSEEYGHRFLSFWRS